MKTATTETLARERPRSFKDHEVKAILSGAKTQFRVPANEPETAYLDGRAKRLRIGCPCGLSGDRLWVRESFLPCTNGGYVDHKSIRDATYVCFRDGSQKFLSGGYYQEPPRDSGFNWPLGARWRPSSHMPKWASRITLEITEVRVERVQGISITDAEAEGVEWNRGPFRCGHTNPISAFRSLWDSIHGAGAWKRNDWVWAVSFRRIE